MIPQVQEASVSVSNANADTGGSTYTVSFLSWPVTPHENNKHFHSGSPSLDQFYCNTTLIDKSVANPSCKITDVKQPTPIREYVQCGGHGTCDVNFGRCKCQPGWKGLACDDNKDKVSHCDSGEMRPQRARKCENSEKGARKDVRGGSRVVGGVLEEPVVRSQT